MARVSAKIDSNQDLVKLGSAIRARRMALALSQEALADYAEIDRSHMGKIERGEHVPTLPLILKISVALKISAAELMAATERNLRAGTEK